MNIVMHADNLDALVALRRSCKGRVGLIYADPPFATNNVFRIDGDRANTISAVAGAPLAYEDVLKGQEYLDMVKERLQLAYDLLSEEGSLYLHIDCKVGYDMKVVLDGIFGPSRFRNSISRIKSNPKNFVQRGYGSVKDTILFYTKSDRFVWNEPRMPPTQQRLNQFNKKDERGQYTTAPLHAPGETINGSTGRPWRGSPPPEGRHWRYAPRRLEELDAQGLIEWSKTGNPRLKVYADDVAGRGVLLQDVWEFKDPQHPTYPTEKNPTMLEIIIRTSSNPGDLVLDPFCGSGTTLLAAGKHGRRFIGMDNSKLAIDCTRKRLGEYPFEMRQLPSA